MSNLNREQRPLEKGFNINKEFYAVTGFFITTAHVKSVFRSCFLCWYLYSQLNITFKVTKSSHPILLLYRGSYNLLSSWNSFSRDREGAFLQHGHGSLIFCTCCYCWRHQEWKLFLVLADQTCSVTGSWAAEVRLSIPLLWAHLHVPKMNFVAIEPFSWAFSSPVSFDGPYFFCGKRPLFQSLSWLLHQSILQVWPLGNGLADFFATLVAVSGKLRLKNKEILKFKKFWIWNYSLIMLF